MAGELETELVAVNQRPALRRSLFKSGPGQSLGDEQTEGQVGKGKSGGQGEKSGLEGRREKSKSEGRTRKSKTEMVRRGAERHELERMCSLFRARGKGWTRKEVLSLGEKTSLSMDAMDHLPIPSQSSCSDSTALGYSPLASSWSAPLHRGCRYTVRLERTRFLLFIRASVYLYFSLGTRYGLLVK